MAKLLLAGFCLMFQPEPNGVISSFLYPVELPVSPPILCQKAHSAVRAVAIQEVRRTSRNLICALLITIVTTHLWSHKVLTSSVSVPQTIQFRWQDWPVCDEARHYDDTLLLSGWQSNTLLWPVHRPRPLTLGKLWYGQQAFHKSSPHYLIFLSKNVAPSHHFLAGSAHTPVAVGDARILCTSTHNSLTLNIPRGVLWGPQRVIFCDPAVTVTTNLLLIFVRVPHQLKINIMQLDL